MEKLPFTETPSKSFQRIAEALETIAAELKKLREKSLTQMTPSS